MRSRGYNRQFYEDLRAGADASARVVVPLLSTLLAPDLPRSIIDVGCGDGTWLLIAKELLRPERVLGVDTLEGDASAACRVSGDEFLQLDLESDLNQLADRLAGAFDLAMCLEVGEHLDRDSGPSLVRALGRLAPVILFSAAVPLQGGVHHVNEQWPSYWIALFENIGYRCADALRRSIWTDTRVKWWYRQNLLLFTSEAVLQVRPNMHRFLTTDGAKGALDVVHPELFLARASEARPTRATSLRSRARALLHWPRR
jgi:SAM-dependent methyltransferase